MIKYKKLAHDQNNPLFGNQTLSGLKDYGKNLFNINY